MLETLQTDDRAAYRVLHEVVDVDEPRQLRTQPRGGDRAHLRQVAREQVVERAAVAGLRRPHLLDGLGE